MGDGPDLGLSPTLSCQVARFIVGTRTAPRTLPWEGSKVEYAEPEGNLDSLIDEDRFEYIVEAMEPSESRIDGVDDGAYEGARLSGIVWLRSDVRLTRCRRLSRENATADCETRRAMRG